MADQRNHLPPYHKRDGEARKDQRDQSPPRRTIDFATRRGLSQPQIPQEQSRQPSDQESIKRIQAYLEKRQKTQDSSKFNEYELAIAEKKELIFLDFKTTIVREFLLICITSKSINILYIY